MAKDVTDPLDSYLNKTDRTENSIHNLDDPLDKYLQKTSTISAPATAAPKIFSPASFEDMPGYYSVKKNGNGSGFDVSNWPPAKSKWQMAKEALLESENDFNANIGQKALMGAPGAVSNAIVGPPQRPQPLPNGPAKHWEDYLPSSSTLTDIPAMAIDTAVFGGPLSKAAEGISPLVRKLPAAVQRITKGVTAGGLFGATDAAVRGEDLAGVAKGGLRGVVGGAGTALIPEAAAGVENWAQSGPVKRLATKLVGTGKVDSSRLTDSRPLGPETDVGPTDEHPYLGEVNENLILDAQGNPVASGSTIPEKIASRMNESGKEFTQGQLSRTLASEGLDHVSPENLAAVVKARADGLQTAAISPIRRAAFAAAPDATVDTATVQAKINNLLTDAEKGTKRHYDIEDAVHSIPTRAKKIGDPNQIPLENL